MSPFGDNKIDLKLSNLKVESELCEFFFLCLKAF